MKIYIRIAKVCNNFVTFQKYETTKIYLTKKNHAHYIGNLVIGRQ